MENFEIREPSSERICRAFISDDLTEGERESILLRASEARITRVRFHLEYISDLGYRLLDSENYFREVPQENPYL